MRARFYDPALGRFISEDPVGTAGGMNLYAYANNDPINLWDPSGLEANGPCHVDLKCPGVPLPDIIVDTDAPPLEPPGAIGQNGLQYPALPQYRGYPQSPGGAVQNAQYRMQGRQIPLNPLPRGDPCAAWSLAMAGGFVGDVGTVALAGGSIQLAARGAGMMVRGGAEVFVAARVASAAKTATTVLGQAAVAARGVTMMSNGAHLTAFGTTLVAADALAVGVPSAAPTSFNVLEMSLFYQARQARDACRANH